MTKDWVIAPQAPREFTQGFPEISPVLLQLLWARGIHTQSAIDEFLNPDWEKDIHDPYLFNDMEKVVGRLKRAIGKKEKIVVYGDYDADGVPGAVILKSTLDALGAVTGIYIPHREKEGYGISQAALTYLETQNAKVLITCDCGISNRDEVEGAVKLGIDVIITDHHRLPPALPPAFAIVHPLREGEKYPFKYLTGGAVAFKVAQALLKGNEHNVAVGFEKWMLDLVAISLVADVGKLVGENRTLLKYGLIVLNKTRRKGLQQMYQRMSSTPGSITTTTIGWAIAPRINAAGRMDHANVAFQLLITEDDAEAAQLADALEGANTDRQRATEKVVKEALALAQAQGSQPIYMVQGEEWNQGVIGISASRVMEKVGRPVAICVKNEKNEVVCSFRSLDAFNVVEALDQCHDVLLRFGGHPKAAGCSLTPLNWEPFCARMKELAEPAFTNGRVLSQLVSDVALSLDDITWDLWRELEKLSPYGEGNKEPRFLLSSMEVTEVKGMGADGKHLRIMVKSETGKVKKLIGFSFGNVDKHSMDWGKRLTPGTHIDAVIEIGVNEWNGNSELQLKIVDLRLAL